MGKAGVAPEREGIQSLSELGVNIHRGTLSLVYDSSALAAQSFGGSGLGDFFASKTVVIASMCACIGGLLFGFDQGILSIALTMPQFLRQFPETDASVTSGASLNKGVMTALLELGAVLGAFLSGFLADRYSRKMSIVFGSVWFVVGGILQASSSAFAQLVIGRFIGGFGIGVLSSTAPMYISEVAPPNIRGALLTMEQGAIVLGVVIMYYISYGSRLLASDWAFRLPFSVQMAPCPILVVLLYFLPYSPRWLAMSGRDRDCLDSLCRLRQLPSTDPRVQAEWIVIRADAVRAREVEVLAHPSLSQTGSWSEFKLEMASWGDMFRGGVIRQTMIGIVIMFFQQFTGINALVYYAPILFQQLGLDYELQLTLAGVLNITQFVAVLIAFVLLDRVGRRPMLLAGAVSVAISHAIVAAMIATYSYDWTIHKVPAWVGVGFIFGVMLCYGIGWGPVPWALPAEVHASSRRAKGVALSVCSNWFNNFIVGLITPPLITGTGGYGAFIFFAAFSALAAVWTFFFVPETRGRTLEQIDALFESSTAIEDARAREEILQIMTGDAHNSAVSTGEVYKAKTKLVERVGEEQAGQTTQDEITSA
ncbi:hypothetical protein JCM24511_02661 [Saitozyma sp. JCM 24511]|nr:hypothetical protein JCM24511_02661 [Saitozyma sp. JCM 24511]